MKNAETDIHKSNVSTIIFRYVSGRIYEKRKAKKTTEKVKRIIVRESEKGLFLISKKVAASYQNSEFSDKIFLNLPKICMPKSTGVCLDKVPKGSRRN